MSDETRYQAALDSVVEVKNKVNALHAKAIAAIVEDEDSTKLDTALVVSQHKSMLSMLGDLTKVLNSKRSKARKRERGNADA